MEKRRLTKNEVDELLRNSTWYSTNARLETVLFDFDDKISIKFHVCDENPYYIDNAVLDTKIGEESVTYTFPFLYFENISVQELLTTQGRIVPILREYIDRESIYYKTECGIRINDDFVEKVVTDPNWLKSKFVFVGQKKISPERIEYESYVNVERGNTLRLYMTIAKGSRILSLEIKHSNYDFNKLDSLFIDLSYDQSPLCLTQIPCSRNDIEKVLLQKTVEICFDYWKNKSDKEIKETPKIENDDDGLPL